MGSGGHLTMAQWATERVYRGFPGGQESMWLLGASVLMEVLQGEMT